MSKHQRIDFWETNNTNTGGEKEFQKQCPDLQCCFKDMYLNKEKPRWGILELRTQVLLCRHRARKRQVWIRSGSWGWEAPASQHLQCWSRQENCWKNLSCDPGFCVSTLWAAAGSSYWTSKLAWCRQSPLPHKAHQGTSVQTCTSLFSWSDGDMQDYEQLLYIMLGKEEISMLLITCTVQILQCFTIFCM